MISVTHDRGKDREEGLLARLTALLVKDPLLKGMQAHAIQSTTGNTTTTTIGLTEVTEPAQNKTTGTTGLTRVPQTTVSIIQPMITTGRPRSRRRCIYVPEVGLHLHKEPRTEKTE